MLQDQGDGAGGRRLIALLDEAAARAPDRAFLVEDDARGVRHTLAFAQASERSSRIAAALLALGANERRPVMILAGNGIDHALVMFGALRAGVPVVPVDAEIAPERVQRIAEVVRPAVVFAGDRGAAAPIDSRYVNVRQLLQHNPLAVQPQIDGETVAKILFTGVADEPKGVVTTHGMIAAMLEALGQAWPFLDVHPPVLVDWQPWSRWMGGNVVLGIALRGAGTVYLGKAMRREIMPTIAFDVPSGWSRWVDELRGDDALRARWLSRLDIAAWYAATLAPATRDALRALGVPLAALWGTTETAGPVAVTRSLDVGHDALGALLPGVELKLVRDGDACEAGVRGPQVTPGYWWRSDLTAAAFDEDGFYRSGDVVEPLDARRPERGLRFVGRTDDRFKLSSGEWVDGSALRAAFLRACPDAEDVIVAGDGRDEVGVLVWPRDTALALGPRLLRSQIAAAMRAVGTRRGLIVQTPLPRQEPRRVALARHAALVSRLYASEPDAEVITV